MARDDERLGGRPGSGKSDEAAHYLSEQICELTRLARYHDFGTLSYLLDMARLEAAEQIKRLAGSG